MDIVREGMDLASMSDSQWDLGLEELLGDEAVSAARREPGRTVDMSMEIQLDGEDEPRLYHRVCRGESLLTESAWKEILEWHQEIVHECAEEQGLEDELDIRWLGGDMTVDVDIWLEDRESDAYQLF